jgi:hypothetical protein
MLVVTMARRYVWGFGAATSAGIESHLSFRDVHYVLVTIMRVGGYYFVRIPGCGV